MHGMRVCVYTNDELRKYSKIALLLLVQFLKHILFEYSQIHFPKLRYTFLNQYISIKCFECSLLIYCQGMNIRTFMSNIDLYFKYFMSQRHKYYMLFIAGML